MPKRPQIELSREDKNAYLCRADSQRWPLGEKVSERPSVLLLFRKLNGSVMAEKICGIYKIVSKIHTDRIYIGSGIDLTRRWYDHRRELRLQIHRNSRLQNHYNKYGVDDLSFGIIEKVGFVSTRHLVEREQYYIDTLNPWFNINKIADRPNGGKRDPSVGEKISKKLKGRESPMKGKKTGRVPKSAFKKGQPSAYKGYKSTPETKNKLRIALQRNQNHKGHKQPPEAIQKIKEKRQGQIFSVESIKKKSESLKKTWAIRKANGYVSPSKGKKRESPSAETRKKISDTLKEYNKNKRNKNQNA